MRPAEDEPMPIRSGPDDPDVDDERVDEGGRDVETGIDPDAPARTVIEPDEPAVEPNEPA